MANNNEMLNLINQARSQARFDVFKNFFRKRRRNIATLTIVATIALVGYFIFSFYQKYRQEEFSIILYKSIFNEQIGEKEKAKGELKEIIDAMGAPSGVRSIASLRYASIILGEGKKDEALKIYEEVNDCRFCNEYARDLSGLLLVKILVAENVPNKDLPERILKIEKHSGILKDYFAEQRAMLALQNENLKDAYEIFTKIAQDKNASPDLKSRAEDGIKMVVGKGYKVEADEKK